MNVSSINTTADQDFATTDNTSGSTLDKDAFMQLLVTQMQNQDPTDPMDNSEMTAQLAQFSSLEQLENLNSSFAVSQQSATAALSLMSSGRQVDLELTSGETVSGVLEKVQWNQEETQFVVNGEMYSAGSVRSLCASAEPQAAVEE